MNVNPRARDWTSLPLASVLLVLLVLLESAVGQSSDVRFAEGLRSRRLFELAAAHCRQRLADSALEPLERAELTGELIRVYGEQAMHAGADDRRQSWQLAHDTAAKFLRDETENPRLLIVRIQDALVWCAEAELLRQEAEAARGDTQSQFAAALDVSRQAARALEQLDTDIGQVLPTAPASSAVDVLTADELFALRNHVRLELARAYRNRGFCYPEGDDRIAAITQALEPLRAALGQLPADDPLAWQARLEEAICFRLLGSDAEAQRVLASLASDKSPPELAAAIRAEEIRAAMAAGRPADVAARSAAPLPAGAELHADLSLARLEAMVAAWQQAASSGNQQQADEWRQKTVALTQFIEQTHGHYWGRRAEQLLLRTAAAGSGAGDVEILRRRADDFYLQAKLNEAIAAYDEAAAAAATAKLTDEEFLARFRAALVAQKAGQLPECQSRFRELALKLPNHPQAPDAHLEAIKVAIELARDNSEQLPVYEQLLLEHLEHWAAAASADQARVWLGMLYHRSDQRWDEAIAAYTAVAPDSPLAAAALSGAQSAWLEQLRGESDGSKRAAIVARATKYFQDFARRAAAEESVAQAAVGMALVLLEFSPARATDALPWLQAAAAKLASSPNHSLRDELESLTIAIMALDPAQQAQAAQRLEKWRSSDLQMILALTTRFAALSEQLPPEQKKRLADLQLQLVERLRASDTQPLDPSMQTQVLRIEALALAAAGQRDRALPAFQRLIELLPRDGEIQIEYARLLQRGGDRDSWNAALTQWSNVARFSKPRSDAWYEAKCGIALARIESQQNSEAAQLLKYLLHTSPPPPGSAWELRLKELLARAE